MKYKSLKKQIIDEYRTLCFNSPAPLITEILRASLMYADPPAKPFDFSEIPDSVFHQIAKIKRGSNSVFEIEFIDRLKALGVLYSLLQADSDQDENTPNSIYKAIKMGAEALKNRSEFIQ